MIPTQSRLLAYASIPQREINPYDGFIPTTPQYAAGSLVDPPVSDANALRVIAIDQLPVHPTKHKIETRFLHSTHSRSYSDSASSRTPSSNSRILCGIVKIVPGESMRARRVDSDSKMRV